MCFQIHEKEMFAHKAIHVFQGVTNKLAFIHVSLQFYSLKHFLTLILHIFQSKSNGLLFGSDAIRQASPV